MIEVRNLKRRYGEFTAVDDVSFAVGDGEIVGLLGPNGAGKTTTLRMITGFLPPTEGEIRVCGRDLVADPVRARRDIGYLPETVALYPEMRVREYLAYRAQLEGMQRLAARVAIGETIERCLLEEVKDQIVGTLSRGYRQRVGLAAAILHGPRVLVLDEPTVGLDPRQIIAIRELIRELGQSHTLLLSTHILPEVELLCRRILIVDGGRLVGEGTPESLRRQWLGNAALRLLLKGDVAEAEGELARLPGCTGARAARAGEDTEVSLEAKGETDLREAAFRLAVERNWTLLGLTQEKASLEDLFVRLTTREPAGAESAERAAAAIGEVA